MKRTHSRLSASGAHRWMSCTPSANLEATFPDTTSEAAREGTLAHELAELKAKNYFRSVDFGKRKLTAAIKELKKQELWNDEMMTYTDEYLDYIKTIALAMKSEPHVDLEKRVYFGAYTMADPLDDIEGYGTADCVLISKNVIHIVDFKYGKSPSGRVEAEGNPQLALYALGAYEACKLWYTITDVALHIVQPRLKDGISKWECSLKELLAFGNYVRERAALAVNGEGDFRPSETNCRYCRARRLCRARADENVRLAFAVSKTPPLISNEEMGMYLTQGADVAKWLNDLQDCALAECLAGKEVPGWKAVEGRGSRDWSDMDKAFDVLKSRGIEETILYERRPISLAQAEKVIGEKEFTELVGDLIIKKPGKPALAKETDRREAITNKITASEVFSGDPS